MNIRKSNSKQYRYSGVEKQFKKNNNIEELIIQGNESIDIFECNRNKKTDQ